MKKICVVLMFIMLFVCMTAEVKAVEKKLFFNFGVVTDDTFSFDPFFWTLGASLDIKLGGVFILSPEANVVTYKFKFDTFLLQPALMLNFTQKNFFIGGGIQKYFLISGDSYTSSEWGLKINAGFMAENIKIRGYMDMEFDNLFKDMLIGLQIGLGF